MKAENSNPLFYRSLPVFFSICLLAMIFSCNNTPGFHVNEVLWGPSNAGWISPQTVPELQYKVVMVIRFNRAVSQASLTAPGSVKIDIKGTRDGRTVTGISGSFYPNGPWGTTGEVAFVSDQTGADLIDPGAGENIVYTITVYGTDAGGGVVKDTSDEDLDGDNNGSPGGNYVEVIEIVG